MFDNEKRLADANKITRKYMDSIVFEQRLIDSVIPDLHMQLWGHTFDSPIMMPAFSHLKTFFAKERENAMIDYAIAANQLNMVNFVGTSENDEFEQIIKTGAKSVRIIKPYADKDKILNHLLHAKEQGALAVGMDIDHIFGTDGKYDLPMGELMAPQTMEDMKAYIQATDLPFVVKGVLSVRDAVKCAECGAKAVMISHHSGRLPYAAPPLLVLPEIVREFGEKRDVKIFVDCGISYGADVYKALALGADAACVGRALLPSLLKEGAEGAQKYIRKMNEELAFIMGFTGCQTIKDMDPTVLKYL